MPHLYARYFLLFIGTALALTYVVRLDSDVVYLLAGVVFLAASIYKWRADKKFSKQVWDDTRAEELRIPSTVPPEWTEDQSDESS